MTKNDSLSRLLSSICWRAMGFCCFLGLCGGCQFPVSGQNSSNRYEISPAVTASRKYPQAAPTPLIAPVINAEKNVAQVGVPRPENESSARQTLPPEEELPSLVEQERVLLLHYGPDDEQVQTIRARIKAVQDVIALNKTRQADEQTVAPPGNSAITKAFATSSVPSGSQPVLLPMSSDAKHEDSPVVAQPKASEPRPEKEELNVSLPLVPLPIVNGNVVPQSEKVELKEPLAQLQNDLPAAPLYGIVEEIAPPKEPASPPPPLNTGTAEKLSPSSRREGSEEESSVLRLLAAKVTEVSSSSLSEQPEEEEVFAFLRSDKLRDSLPLMYIAAVVASLVLSLIVAHLLFYCGSKFAFLFRRQTAKLVVSDTSEPKAAEPETAEPETAEPETAEPETAEPETAEPQAEIPFSPPPTEPETVPIDEPQLEVPVSPPSTEPEAISMSESPVEVPISAPAFLPPMEPEAAPSPEPRESDTVSVFIPLLEESVVEESTPGISEEPVGSQIVEKEIHSEGESLHLCKQAWLAQIVEQNLHWRMQMGQPSPTKANNA